jgi:trypsin
MCEENEERILGGVEATKYGFPWMVSVRLSTQNISRHVCGGVIISDSFILSAASCFQLAQTFPDWFTIHAGIHDLYNQSEDTEQNRTITQAILHPNFNAANLLNNLALVQVSQPFNMKGLNVATISLSNLSSFENLDLIAIGWGASSDSDNPFVPTPLLQQITVRENVPCTEKSTNPQTQLCASGMKYILNFLYE